MFEEVKGSQLVLVQRSFGIVSEEVASCKDDSRRRVGS